MLTFDQWWQGLSPAEFRIDFQSEDEAKEYFCKLAWNIALSNAVEIARGIEVGPEAGCHYGDEAANEIEKLKEGK